MGGPTVSAMNALRRPLQILARGLLGSALALSASCASDARAMSERRAQALLVVTESGPNSLDIHGVGANRQTYGLSWNVYDRLISYGLKAGANGIPSYDYQKL